MATFCGLLNVQPDDLATVTPKEAPKIQQLLATDLKEELHLKDHTITMELSSRHSFWRANNVRVLTTEVIKYGGLPSLQRLVKAKVS